MTNLEAFLNHYNKEINHLFCESCLHTGEQKIKLSALEDVLRFVYNWSLTEIRTYASDYIKNNIKK